MYQEFYEPLLSSGVENLGEGELLENASYDPRHPGLGIRIYTTSSGQSFQADNVISQESKFYDLMRFCYNVPEFEENFGNPPHKSSLDFFGSLDLKKGCFLGQELTARTEFNGVSLKLIF